jgi:hypothetical protein
MDYTIAITIGITALFLILFYSAITKGNKAALLVLEGGKKELKVHKLMYYIGLGTIILAFVLLIIPFFLTDEPGFLILLTTISILAIGIGLAGMYLLAEYRNAWVFYDDKEIQIVNYRRQRKTLKWTDIQKISVNSFTNRIILKTKHGNVGFNQFMQGINHFLKDAEAITGISTKKELAKVNAFDFTTKHS